MKDMKKTSLVLLILCFVFLTGCNNYGKKFSVGKIYITSGTIKFGNNGNGFHLCKNIEHYCLWNLYIPISPQVIV